MLSKGNKVHSMSCIQKMKEEDVTDPFCIRLYDLHVSIL